MTVFAGFFIADEDTIAQVIPDFERIKGVNQHIVFPDIFLPGEAVF